MCLFNIFLCNLYRLIKDIDISSSTDENTSFGDHIDEVISALKNASASLFKWFSDNQVKTNPDNVIYALMKAAKRK